MKKPLYLYLVERTDDVDYDEYVSAVFAAESPMEALNMEPGNDGWEVHGKVTLKCTRIGTAARGIKKGPVHTHFYHG